MSSDDPFLEKVQFSEKDVSGVVNRCNVRIWGSENLHAYVEHQCFVQSPVKKCAVHSSLLNKPLLA
jgi:hypothetical protein